MKKRYVFAGLFIILWLINPKPYIFLVIPALIWTLILIRKIESKSKEDSPLKTGEKTQIIITELFLPIIAGMFYYYCFKNQFPLKAKQVRKYNWIIFSIQLVFFILIPVAGYLVWLRTKFN